MQALWTAYRASGYAGPMNEWLRKSRPTITRVNDPETVPGPGLPESGLQTESAGERLERLCNEAGIHTSKGRSA